MSLQAGTRLGPYEVIATIGAGGMGEVYRARDTRLGRDVAVKVLPPLFASDPERRARFEREAQTVAALSHPHIVSVFDTGFHEGQIFVVMELLDGESLRERLTTGALTVRKAIEYGVQIAKGLAAAHDKGLVHRDLKPDNIFLLADGHVKILDFGLARAAVSDTPGSGATETVAALTDPGLIMGTMGYMAPEQVRGRGVDGRTDLFAFGAVLYEMLTGARAFHRETPADTMSAILKEDPPELASARADLPPALERIIRHCLEKNPAERFQSARDVAFALEALTGSAATTTIAAAQSGPIELPRRRTPTRELAAWLLAVAGIAALGFVLLRPRAESAGLSVARFNFPIEGSQAALSTVVAVSPDGRSVVVAASPSSDTRLRLRRIDSMETVPLVGTEGATSATWSPGGDSIGFVAVRTMKRFDLATSSVRKVAELPAGFGTPAWSKDGTILVGGLGQPVLRVAETGGDPTPVGALDAASHEVGQLRPVFLPDGRRFFYYSVRGLGYRPVLASLDSDKRSPLDLPDARVVWAGEDEIVFRRADAIFSQHISYDPLALVGEPNQIVSGLDVLSATSVRESASTSGVMAWMEASNRRQQFRWYARDGRPLGNVGDPGRYSTFDLSSNGSRIVASMRSPGPGNQNLWVLDADGGTTTRMTLSDAQDVDPRWSPEETSVIFGSTRDVSRGPFKVAIAAGNPAPVWKYDGRMYSGDDWSRDGRWLLFHDAAEPVLKARQLDVKGAPTGEPVVVAIALTGTIDQAQMSPDGKWVAFNSNESGRYEIYVVPFPATGDRVTVSRAGGTQPTWKADGSELYFLTPEGALDAVKVTVSGAKLTTSTPVELLRSKIASVSPSVEQYAAHPSGTKFLFLDTVGDDKNVSIGVLLNWRGLMTRPGK